MMFTFTFELELYRAYSIFGQFVKSCQMFLKLNSKKQYQSSGKENESRLAFTSSTKRKIKHFHVVVVQWGRRNVHKKRGARRRCRCLSLLFFIVYLGIGI